MPLRFKNWWNYISLTIFITKFWTEKPTWYLWHGVQNATRSLWGVFCSKTFNRLSEPHPYIQRLLPPKSVFVIVSYAASDYHTTMNYIQDLEEHKLSACTDFKAELNPTTQIMRHRIWIEIKPLSITVSTEINISRGSAILVIVQLKD